MDTGITRSPSVTVQHILTERSLKEVCDFARSLGEDFLIRKDEQRGGWNFITRRKAG